MSKEKIKRNKQLVQLHLKDPKVYSLRKLAVFFKIKPSSVHTIFHRDKDKYPLAM